MDNKKDEQTPEVPENQDAVWNIVQDDSELIEFKKRYRRRLIIHLCTAFFAALLFGYIAYSGVFDPPENKLETQYVKTTALPASEKERTPAENAAAPVERIRKAFAATDDPAVLTALQKELAALLKTELKDDPAALKLHFELSEKIRAAEQKK